MDIPLTQLLGVRLLSGQDASGGWGYATWDGSGDVAALKSAMQPKDPSVVQAKPQPDPNLPPPPPPKLHPLAYDLYVKVRGGLRSIGGGANNMGGDDNSNTQFAIVALWVCHKRGVPSKSAFQAIENRFIRSQNTTDHGWGYSVGYGGQGGSGASMTCAGLIGLAAATGAKDDPKPQPAGAQPKEKRLKDEDGFFNPPEKGGGTDPDLVPEQEEEEKQKVENPLRMQAIERGLRAIGRLLKGGTGPAGTVVGGWGGVDDLYFIWSLERVGVAFGLETIGDVDWYNWGCDKLIAGQQADGSWKAVHGVGPDTCFAVLFLAKSNFVSDLTRSIKGKVKDPGAAEMRGGRGVISAAGNKETVRETDKPAAPPPGITAVGENPADTIADDLLNAKDGQWATRLRVARDGKGGQHTSGLVKAIPRLEGVGRRQFQAREALAERLVRMTVPTLKRMMNDRDPELRRAACLAAGMRDDRELITPRIDRVLDTDESVIRAAKASLRSLTDQTLGPPLNASDDAKEKAYDAWLIWFGREGRGK